MRIQVPYRDRLIKSYDGTQIKVYEFEGDGPPVVLCPGLGTPIISWKRVIEEFSSNFRFFTWDTRGCYESETPANLDALTLGDHASDMEAAVNAFGLHQFATAGWSMGVGIALEYYHRHPDQITALITINGAYRNVLKTAFSMIPAAETVLSSLVKFARDTAHYTGPVLSWLLSQPWAIDVLKTARIVTAGEEFFGAVVSEFKSMRWPIYFQMMLKYNEHNATEYLPKISVPTLVTAGTKDFMTPVAVAKEMAESIPGAELFVVPNGTHYTILEYPDILNLKLEQFLRKVFPEAF